MDDWKQLVAANLTILRKEHKLTQLQLAEQLHYSDKAVSKWERGESLPDLAVMKQLADFYGILIDDFLLPPEELASRRSVVIQPEASVQQAEVPADALAEQNDEPAAAPQKQGLSQKKKNRLIIVGMAALLVWLIATMIFVVLDAVLPELRYGPFLFLYAAPITAVVCLVFNSIWFDPRWNYAIISVLVWTVLLAIFLTFYQYHIWKLFLIGIPAQLIILLWSRLRPSNVQNPPAQEKKQ
ncbi:MAG TPA: hypothetical protein DDX71_04865 [Ruminococcus sp.]|nr:hypothetical protein [Ruminococcus sp.]